MATVYKKALISIAGALEEMEVKQLAFLAAAVGNLNPKSFPDGLKLFERLEASSLISHEKPGFLRTLLENIGQKVLAEKITGQSVTLDPDVSKKFRDRVEIYKILVELEFKDVKLLILLYNLSKDRVKDELDLGLELLKSQRLNDGFASNLREIGRSDLEAKMKTYLGGHLTNPEEVPRVSTDSDDLPEFGHPTMSDFRRTLINIGNELSWYDVRNMVFLANLPQRRFGRDTDYEPSDFFNDLERRGLIREDDPTFLRELLEIIDRKDLADRLPCIRVDLAERMDQVTGGHLTNPEEVPRVSTDSDDLPEFGHPTMSDFRRTLLNIGKELSWYDVRNMVFLAQDTQGRFRRDTDYAATDFFSNLERRGLIREDDPTFLRELLEIIGRKDLADRLPCIRVDLAERMDQVTGGHLTNPEEVPRVSTDSDDLPKFGEEFEVKVEKSKEQFVKDKEKGSYPMKSIPRGLVLIINVKQVLNFIPREGTDVDRDKLKSLFTQLHFKVIVHNDSDGLTAHEIEEKIKKFSEREDHAHSDASIICLLSHGIEDHILGTDDRAVKLSDIYSMFNAENCPNLVGKPKIFIHQACRGPFIEYGVPQMVPQMDGSGGKTPTNADMLFCFPTEFGYKAFRYPESGSRYIQNIVIIFMRYAKDTEINLMMTLVNGRLARMETTEMQMPEALNRLTKPLYFFP